MATTNHDRVGKALELLKAGLGPFVALPRCREDCTLERGGRLRIISARRATRREQNQYEEAVAETKP